LSARERERERERVTTGGGRVGGIHVDIGEKVNKKEMCRDGEKA
jgi:hypothetical protein